MPLTEFDIITRYFSQATASRDDVVLGIGDDAALIVPPDGQQLAIAIDTLVAGVHFPVQTDPYDIGWKALAVNLSDLAAMGAEPAWFTLALTAEQADEAWLSAFSQGMADLAGHYNMQLIGGDTTRGPLTVTVQIGGYVPGDQALHRQGARMGDEIWVSGTPGDAALGLRLMQEGIPVDQTTGEFLTGRLNRPQPRVELGMALRDLATSCIDISDGLVADLGHICDASDCGALLRFEQLPVSRIARQVIMDYPDYANLPLAGGDDYELCFTAPGDSHALIQAVADRLDCALTLIGEITAGPGVSCLDGQGQPMPLTRSGYRHFDRGSE